jgi:hypothetical protein
MLDADHDNSLQCVHLPADLRWCNAALTRTAGRECRLEVKRGRWLVVIIERMWEVVEASATISLHPA